MKNNSIADFVAASMDAALKSDEYKTLFGTQYKYASECDKCHKMHGDKDSCMADDQDAKKKDSKDSSSADDNAAKKSKDSSSSSSSSKDSSSADDNDARGGKKCKECGKPMGLCKCDKSSADDNFGDGKDPNTGATVSGGGSKIEFQPDSIKGPSHKPAHASDSHSANTLDSTTANPYPGKQYDADEYRNADVLKADDDEKVSSAFDVAIDSLLTASAALDHVGLGRGSAISLKLASLVVEAKKKEKDSKKSKDSKKDSKKSDSNSAKDKKKDSKDSKDSKKDSHSAKDKKSDSKDSKKDSKDSKKSSKK